MQLSSRTAQQAAHAVVPRIPNPLPIAPNLPMPTPAGPIASLAGVRAQALCLTSGHGEFRNDATHSPGANNRAGAL